MRVLLLLVLGLWIQDGFSEPHRNTESLTLLSEFDSACNKDKEAKACLVYYPQKNDYYGIQQSLSDEELHGLTRANATVFATAVVRGFNDLYQAKTELRANVLKKMRYKIYIKGTLASGEYRESFVKEMDLYSNTIVFYKKTSISTYDVCHLGNTSDEIKFISTKLCTFNK